MGDMVRFDPIAVDRLARQLASLDDTLGPALRQISQILSGQGGHLAGSGAIEGLVAAAHKDAGDMSQRARQTRELAQKEGSGAFFGRSFWPQLDWQASSQSGVAARKDAADLKSALALGNKDKAASRQRLLAVARDMHAHLHDKAYLATLWNSLDSDAAARLARVLHNQDADGKSTDKPTVLSAESERILKDVASSLAAASSYRQTPTSKPENLLGGDREKVFVNASDKWSVGMLFKYGPNGENWDPHFLSAMTASMLQWHQQHPYLPKDSRTAWYRDLGIQWAPGPSDLNKSAQAALKKFDPTIPVLDRTSENSDASRWALQDKGNVHVLVHGDWIIPGNYGQGYDASGSAGAVLRSGVTFPRGTTEGAKEAAQALVNIVSEVKAYHIGRLKNKTMQDVLALPFGLRHSLTQIAGSYLPDFAHSASSKDTTLGLRHGDDGLPYAVTMNHDDVQDFLDEALRQSPQDFGWLKGRIKGLVTAGVMQTQAGNGSATDYPADAAELFAVLHSVDAMEKIARGHEDDVLAAEQKSAKQTVSSVIGMLPGGYGIDKATKLAGKAFTISDIYMDGPSEGNEQNARLGAEQDGIKANFDLPPLIVQGLIAAGKLSPSTREPWLTGGVVSSDDGFEDWYKENRNIAISVVMHSQDGRPMKPTRMTLEQYVNQVSENYRDVKDWFPSTAG
ncbi:hypothetical protein [Actinoallomurus iriomotensis]|uniref:Uncharacterized protein n=1 Tax=Actinoallomurus iriomotensis TaxID=478107 RepID=A0A9W6S8E6_9ACTN|nr:hypothetical protein [Actinoallomurus iriomotensis]GLY89254.1 hypothetical protein Airi02_071830 [Actinoallomurus iriomotensis]